MNEQLLNELFYNKRTIGNFKPQEVSDELLKKLYELTSHGATAFNAQPARFVFIKSQEAKARLKPFLMPGNVDKTMNAPVTVIVATDNEFHNLLHKTFPIADIKGMFTSNKQMTETTAFRNSSMAGAYLMSSAHVLGLDTGAMSGFNNAGVDEEFFKGTEVKSNFLINLGYGDYEGIQPRLPRLSFEEASQIL
jgi:3-hydroxypropanoate dehydrogenase